MISAGLQLTPNDQMVLDLRTLALQVGTRENEFSKIMKIMTCGIVQAP
jgi:hypothetical protein